MSCAGQHPHVHRSQYQHGNLVLLSMSERRSGSIIVVVAMGGGGGGEQEGELSRLRGTTSSNSTVHSISFGLLVVVAVVLANIGY